MNPLVRQCKGDDMTTIQDKQTVNPEDKLLQQVTRAAKLVHTNEQSLSVLVTQCCDEEIDRDDVIDAIVDAGWSQSRARSVVSAIYISKNKRERKTGAGRETPAEAIELAKYAQKQFGSKQLARRMLLAAYRFLKRK